MKELYRATGIQRILATKSALEADDLAVETLLRLHDQNGIFASLLGTPSDLEALYVGHCITEGFGPAEHDDILIKSTPESGYDVISETTVLTKNDSHDPQRIVTSSCGACNAPGLEVLVDGLPPYTGAHSIMDLAMLNHGLDEMKNLQIGFQKTGGMHGAGIMHPTDGILAVSEDIGRHNAVDKVVGTGVLNGIDFDRAILLLSGRCGWDIVAKAARSGIGTIVCVGACSTLAADAARTLQMRIYAFVKPNRCVAIGAHATSSNGKP